MSATGTYLQGGLNVTSLPSLGSLTQGSSSGATGTTTNQRNAAVLGGVSIPLYDGGVRSSRLLDAQSRSGAAEAEVSRLQQSAASEIVSADDALRTSLAAYQAAGALVKASSTAENATFAAYRAARARSPRPSTRRRRCSRRASPRLRPTASLSSPPRRWRS